MSRYYDKVTRNYTYFHDRFETAWLNLLIFQNKIFRQSIKIPSASFSGDVFAESRISVIHKRVKQIREKHQINQQYTSTIEESLPGLTANIREKTERKYVAISLNDMNPSPFWSKALNATRTLS